MKTLSSYLSIAVLIAFFLANIVVITDGHGGIFNGISAAGCLFTAFYVAYR